METIKLNVSISELSETHTMISDAPLSKKYKNLRFLLSYPLRRKVEVRIERAEKISDVLIPLADMYKNIYSLEGNPFGIRWHVITDLAFEELRLKEKGLSEVTIGS